MWFLLDTQTVNVNVYFGRVSAEQRDEDAEDVKRFLSRMRDGGDDSDEKDEERW